MELGIDTVSISRIEAAMQRHGHRFLERFLSEEEMVLATKAPSVAGLWAAKEAVAKSLGCGIGSELAFHDILIRKNAKGKPSFVLTPSAQAIHSIGTCSLSITHDGGIAIAVAAIVSA